MPEVSRVLDPSPVNDLAAYRDGGGGGALAAAREVEPEALIGTVEAAGLRGRGGAGFPTGAKWRTVAGMGAGLPATVVVNGAEGEPGTFKDRAILRANPYRVIEGALVAAHAVGADRVVVALKSGFDRELARVEAAIAEVTAAGWTDVPGGGRIVLEAFSGPPRYLFGEETAMLEALNGRPPFPRVAPPYRHGAREVGDVGEGGGSARAELVDESGDTSAPPTLVDNVETMANVPFVIGLGPDAYRSVGTAESPGTIVCTVSGRTARAGVVEVALGTPLREVIALAGGEPVGSRIVAVLSGTAQPLLPASALDAPVSWEGMAAAGGGLGSAGFIVIDDEVDVLAVVAGVSRFLSVESCGQCTPCKQDGMAITETLVRIATGAGEDVDAERLAALTSTVATGARCYLATQHEQVVSSLLAEFPDALAAHLSGAASPPDPFPIVPIVDLVDGVAVLDGAQLELDPDWGTGTGAAPADAIDTRKAG